MTVVVLKCQSACGLNEKKAYHEVSVGKVEADNSQSLDTLSELSCTFNISRRGVRALFSAP